jgi:thiol:disulfide interchange protein DsbA
MILMKKKLTLLLAGLALIMVASTGCAKQAEEEYTAGIDYAVLPSPIPTSAPKGKVEVLEMFWYGCPHCYHFEPHIKTWMKSKPEAAYFIHVPAALNPSWVVHARAYYAAEQLGVLDKFHDALFVALHEQRRRLNSVDSLSRFAASLGIDEEKFREAMNSTETNSAILKAQEIGYRSMADGVPMIVVDGKYKVTGRMAGGSFENMLKIVDYLVAKEAAK